MKQATPVAGNGTRPRTSKPKNRPKFNLGRLVATPAALKALNGIEIAEAISRHSAADWGDVGAVDWHENELSLEKGYRLFSVYHARNGTKFWVITEADRSSTCVLLPNDY